MWAVRSLIRGLSAQPLTRSPPALCGRPLLADPPAASALNVVPLRSKYRSLKARGGPRSRKKRYWHAPLVEIDPFEYSELFWRYNHYKTARKSLAMYFSNWKAERYPAEALSAPAVSVASAAPASSSLPEDFVRALEDNDAENASVAKVREARRLEELRFREEERLDTHANWETRVAMEREIREEQIRRKKEIAQTLVTPENLVERIERALHRPSDYNFAIDLGGRKRFGRPDPLRRLNMFDYAREREERAATRQRDAQRLPQQRSSER